MTKAEMVTTIKTLYRAMNRADSYDGKMADESWMVPDMAGVAGCAKLDAMMEAMRIAGVFTSRELQEIYDTL